MRFLLKKSYAIVYSFLVRNKYSEFFFSRENFVQIQVKCIAVIQFVEVIDTYEIGLDCVGDFFS